MIKLEVFGASHSKFIGGKVWGLPKGYAIDQSQILSELKKRQNGYGRSARQQIESNNFLITRGIKNNKTTGGTLEFFIKNFDDDILSKPEITALRSGHADYVGCVKYNLTSARQIAEMSSGRNTLAHTVLGAICKQILATKDIFFYSYVRQIGGVSTDIDVNLSQAMQIEASLVRCPDQTASQQMVELIDKARLNGDTLGGICQVVCSNLPIGLGEIVPYADKLQSLVGRYLLSIPSVKGIEFGKWFGSSFVGSDCVEQFALNGQRIVYDTNFCGGTIGGLTTGGELTVRLAVKPISSLALPTQTIDLLTKQVVTTYHERSDVCVVPNIAVIAENMLSATILNLFSKEGLV
ncbi:MAG: chorismate synthase [Clostridia bacterium]